MLYLFPFPRGVPQNSVASLLKAQWSLYTGCIGQSVRVASSKEFGTKAWNGLCSLWSGLGKVDWNPNQCEVKQESSINGWNPTQSAISNYDPELIVLKLLIRLESLSSWVQSTHSSIDEELLQAGLNLILESNFVLISKASSCWRQRRRASWRRGIRSTSSSPLPISLAIAEQRQTYPLQKESHGAQMGWNDGPRFNSFYERPSPSSFAVPEFWQ
jgi:hypothetical protein